MTETNIHMRTVLIKNLIAWLSLRHAPNGPSNRTNKCYWHCVPSIDAIQLSSPRLSLSFRKIAFICFAFSTVRLLPLRHRSTLGNAKRFGLDRRGRKAKQSQHKTSEQRENMTKDSRNCSRTALNELQRSRKFQLWKSVWNQFPYIVFHYRESSGEYLLYAMRFRPARSTCSALFCSGLWQCRFVEAIFRAKHSCSASKKYILFVELSENKSKSPAIASTDE